MQSNWVPAKAPSTRWPVKWEPIDQCFAPLGPQATLPSIYATTSMTRSRSRPHRCLQCLGACRPCYPAGGACCCPSPLLGRLSDMYRYSQTMQADGRTPLWPAAMAPSAITLLPALMPISLLLLVRLCEDSDLLRRRASHEAHVGPGRLCNRERE